MSDNPIISIQNLHKSFGEKSVLKGISLTVKEGEKLVIIGRSGCGKSVLVKHIVKLLEPDEGVIEVFGRQINQISETELLEIRQRFGYLFQGAALFDSMTVGENIGLPLVEHSRYSSSDISKKVAEKLELVGLSGIEKLKPSELSGGMKKRVGLARAIITDPDVIIYDEPTTGLDPIMSDSIDRLINHLADELNVTTLVITHDLGSVKKVADRVIMVHEGEIHFNGLPGELFESNQTVIQNFVNRISVDDEEIIHELEAIQIKAGKGE